MESTSEGTGEDDEVDMVQVLFDANNVVVVARSAGEIRKMPLLEKDVIYRMLSREDSTMIPLPIAIVVIQTWFTLRCPGQVQWSDRASRHV